MTAFSIEVSNFLFMLMGGYGVYSVLKWKALKIRTGYSEAIRAWVWCFAAITANVGWFAISRHSAPEGFIHHPIEVEYRWILVMGTALAFSWGMLMFIQFVEGYSTTHKIALFLMFLGIALLFGYL